ncbi:YjbH domain-containing protein [Vibrio fluvialis]|uniref:YjbH domain-containing protein n=1 Tax=Vibrio fluvialis TaxID=676 RepID=UPI00068BAFA8|nr:YjbH domain-containing protein [Vibrio fluvialis]
MENKVLRSLGKTNFLFAFVGFTLPMTAVAQAVLSSNQSFSGLVFTPNAQVTEAGTLSFTYAQGVPFRSSISELDSLNFNLGLFQGLEASGRIVTKTYNTNLYTDSNGGIRDLSASFKYQIPAFWKDWGYFSGLNLAVGMQDVEGAANNFESNYAVADYTFDFIRTRASLGYGKSDINGGVLNGVFGGLEVEPFDFMQLVAEYDSVDYNAMVKVFTPKGLLPWNTQASLGYVVYSGHENTDNQNIWQTQLSVPLASDYSTRETQLNNQLSLQDKLTLAQSQAEFSSLTALKQALEQEGFLNIRLGTYNNQLVVALEDRRYNRNQIDGIGVALGLISSHYNVQAGEELGLDNDKFTLVTLRNQLPLLRVDTSAQSYRSFLNKGGDTPELSFSTSDLATVMDDTQWKSKKSRSGFGRTQVILSPGLRYAVATEYGVFDYSLALETNTYTALWPGAALDIRHLTPISDSDDFDTGLWKESAYESKIDRLQFHQAIKLPLDLTYQFSYGVVYTDYQGFKNDLTWNSPSGRHMLNLDVGSYSHRDNTDKYGRPYADHDVRLAGYTFSYPEWDWQFNVKGGEFWNGDSGYQLTTKHWFGDVNVYASYLETKFDSASSSEKFMTLGISFPLTFWRDMSPGYVQLRGTDQFNFSIQTRIDDSHNNLNNGSGLAVPFQHGLEREYFNRGRYGSDYFDNHTIRLRNAYLRWLDEQ